MSEPRTYHNPVQRGFFPDPSVIRVGDDYYMVNSSFQYFPAIPISHSRDMVHWHIIGHAITNPEWLDISDIRDSHGIWAPDIEYVDGKYYIYVTLRLNADGKRDNNVMRRQLVMVSDKPEGPYSKPVCLEVDDIDPSLFVDDDGTPWMSWGNGTCFLVKLKPNMTELDGNIEILKMPKFVEGPWIHKRENLYYLTYASMGKGRETISYATAPSMEGPWTYRGVLTGMAENSFTIHPGIIEFKGQNYLFYHNAILTIDGKSGATGRRSVCVDYLYYLPDGRMAYVEQTKEGITVKPKTAAEVAEIVNPYTDEKEVVVEKEVIAD